MYTFQSKEAADAFQKASMPKLGDIVTVRGQRIKITKIYPNGRFDGEAVP
jgi:hypothetical protein